MSHRSVGVYLGSAMGNQSIYKETAIKLAEGMARLGLTLVYGGASIGLMGILAKTMKANGGKVIGVITEHLASKEISFQDADEMYVVDSMYERKRLIHEKSSQFLVFPGGLGTFDEFFETWCNIKIGVIQKPIGFLNLAGFYDLIFQFLRNCQQEGFLTDKQLNIPSIYPDIQSCLLDLKQQNAHINQEDNAFLLHS